MANLDNAANFPFIESDPIRGGKRLRVSLPNNETLTDPVDRYRVSQPQSMIDTDFEYGTQPTKWETINLTNFRPYATYNVQTPIAITAISSTINSRVVSVTTGTSVSAGTPIFVQDATWEGANGLFTANSTGTTFTYTAQYAAPSTGSILNSTVTALYTGQIFTGAQIGTSLSFTWASGLAIPVTTNAPHGLAIGNEIVVVNTSQPNANGAFTVARIISATEFVYYATTAPAANPTGGQLFVRPQGAALHRAFDGGVKFSSNAQSNNEMLIRQTRKYFRYQSGKGLQMSTGTILKPSFNPDLITSSGTTVTVNTKESHNLQVGARIVVQGCNEAAYNGTFTVTAKTSPTQFQYTALSAPGGSATGQYQVYVDSWVGSIVRVGMYDDQNGLFFEFDGQTLYAVRRASTYQISGSITVANGGNIVTGVGSEYSTQLIPGDMIVIKGQSYKVLRVDSDTQFAISPSYRGPSITAPSFAYITKTIETKFPQSTWNLDRMDGSAGSGNPSGYRLDLSKMQMFYIDYSWYGAGPIRWGFRGTDGKVTYCHKLINNNVNLEAYMRTGNLPARYETNTNPPTTILRASVSPSDTTITVADTTFFPPSGYLVINNNGASAGSIEFVNYTGKTATTFTGLTRARAGEPAGINVTINGGAVVGTVASASNLQVGMRVISPTGFPDGTYVAAISGTTITFSNAAITANPTGVIFSPMGATSGQSYTFNANQPIAVEFGGPTAAPTISHWGSSVIMDGRFDEDKQFLFTAGSTTALSVPTAGNRFALLSIRLAPSVSSGLVGNFGIREIINRMQLSLNEIGIYAQGNYLVTLVLNGTVSAADTWTNVGGSSLTQVCFHGASRTVAGGETVGGFYVNSGGTTFGTTTYNLTRVRDLGNSILGGGAAAVNTQFYPDGPDILTVVVQALTSGTSSVFGRISWTEAQA